MTGQVLLFLRLLLTISLFAFLAWALLTLWRDLSLQSKLLAARKVPPLSLIVQSENNAPQIQNYTQAEITIGRDPGCECAVYDDAVSSQHARLTYHHSQWWLEDLNSTNGTKLNSEPLTTATVIISGDIIYCGHTSITIVFSNDLFSPSANKP
jgi:pSer/pThr/pTyr-binding forkhead associated (FHA) protein